MTLDPDMIAVQQQLVMQNALLEELLLDLGRDKALEILGKTKSRLMAAFQDNTAAIVTHTEADSVRAAAMVHNEMTTGRAVAFVDEMVVAFKEAKANGPEDR